jgi:LmbE family N-acetylglucosaminyl deacetylase
MSSDNVLFVVAHPDDETIFFGGLILELATSGKRVDVVSVTEHFNPSSQSAIRSAEFRKACWKFGARAHLLGLEDAPHEIGIEHIITPLRNFTLNRQYSAIYTHGVWGEYGHIHHREVSLAVHRLFGTKVYSLAGPIRAQFAKGLTDSEFRAKRDIAAYAYPSQPFAKDWCSREERYTCVPVEAVEVLFAIGNQLACKTQKHLTPEILTLVNDSADAFHSGLPYAEINFISPDIWKPAHGLFRDCLNRYLSS